MDAMPVSFSVTAKQLEEDRKCSTAAVATYSPPQTSSAVATYKPTPIAVLEGAEVLKQKYRKKKCQPSDVEPDSSSEVEDIRGRQSRSQRAEDQLVMDLRTSAGSDITPAGKVDVGGPDAFISMPVVEIHASKDEEINEAFGVSEEHSIPAINSRSPTVG